jgi:hyperosmotically inducible protein
MKPFKPATRVASIALALAVGAAFSAAQANAAEPNEPANMKFRQLDKNSNGFIEKSEIRHLPGYEAAFDQADENRDGKLDAGEFLKAESIYDRTRAAAFVEDSVLTTKVKAALLNEPNLKSTEVHVESLKGRVMLSGWVESREQKEKAVKIASAVSGVIEVRDGLKVR